MNEMNKWHLEIKDDVKVLKKAWKCVDFKEPHLPLEHTSARHVGLAYWPPWFSRPDIYNVFLSTILQGISKFQKHLLILSLCSGVLSLWPSVHGQGKGKLDPIYPFRNELKTKVFQPVFIPGFRTYAPILKFYEQKFQSQITKHPVSLIMIQREKTFWIFFFFFTYLFERQS